MRERLAGDIDAVLLLGNSASLRSTISWRDRASGAVRNELISASEKPTSRKKRIAPTSATAVSA